MGRPKKSLNPKEFDYDRMYKDLKDWCSKNGKTLAWVSENVLFHSKNYITAVFSSREIAPQVALAIAKLIGTEMKDYKIVRKPEPKPQDAPKKEACEEKRGWSCTVRVDEEIGVAMLKIYKDGKEIATGRSYTYGGSTEGIVQGISYAAHMCYKMIQQDNIANSIAEEEDAAPDAEDQPNPSARVVFKDWIKKYENDNTKAGTLARYVRSHYAQLPSTGKKRIRGYLRLNGGTAHLITFDSMWSQYFKWCDVQAVEGKRVGLA